MIECMECGQPFETERGLHCHLKAHDLSVGGYYEKYCPRYDLADGSRIKYKSKGQYFAQYFNCVTNMRHWLDSGVKEKQKDVLFDLLCADKVRNALTTSPSANYLEMSHLPSKKDYNLVFGGYYHFCKSIGLSKTLSSTLPDNFWNAPPQMEIWVDTREQQPLDFPKTLSQKLDFGDYTVGGEYYSKTFIERKSAADFASTMSSGIERFENELERCCQFDSYLFIVVESTFKGLHAELSKKYRPNMSYIWHSAKEILRKFPHNTQIVFAHNRVGAKFLIPRLLYHGSAVWDVDIQEAISCRGKKEIKPKD